MAAGPSLLTPMPSAKNQDSQRFLLPLAEAPSPPQQKNTAQALTAPPAQQRLNSFSPQSSSCPARPRAGMSRSSAPPCHRCFYGNTLVQLPPQTVLPLKGIWG